MQQEEADASSCCYFMVKMKPKRLKNWLLPILLSFVLLIGIFTTLNQPNRGLNTNNEFSVFSNPGWYYRTYPWKEQNQKELLVYPKTEPEKNLAAQIQQNTTVPTLIEKEIEEEKLIPSKPTKINVKKIVAPSPPLLPNAIIHASLTGSPGSVAISGTSYQIEVVIDGTRMPEGNFNSSAGAQFTVEIKGKNIQKTIRVSSPSFGTNMIVQSLTLSVNPVTNSASISGKLNLDLPGSMSGTLLNLTNGSASTCMVHDGYFSTSVSLSSGPNQMTAIGKWLTVTLELPSISVLVQ